MPPHPTRKRLNGRRLAILAVPPVTMAALAAGALHVAQAQTTATGGTAAWCADKGDLNVGRMPARITPGTCKLTGRTVVAEHVAARVPAPGRGVTADLELANGHESLTISAAADGTVSIEKSSIRPDTPLRALPAACSDNTFKLRNTGWPANKQFQWTYNLANETDSGLSTINIINALTVGAKHLAEGFNDCGVTRKPKISQLFVGFTSATPSFTPGSGVLYCGSDDGVNTLAWQPMPDGITYKAITCSHFTGGDSTEADIIFNTKSPWWDGNGPCDGRHDLESTVTHEFGHVFGLDDLGAERVGLTMAPTYACDTSRRTLGGGDLAGLFAEYG